MQRINLKRIIIIALLLLLSACSHKYAQETKSFNGQPPKPHVDPPAVQVIKTLYVDSKFIEEERFAIRDAAEQWEQNTQGLIKYNLVFDYDVDMSKISNKIVVVYLNPTDDLATKFNNNLGETFISGYAKTSNAEVIFLVPQWAADNDQLDLIAQRELGHELGLKDIQEDRPAIMNKITNDHLSCPTIYDMIQLCELYLCNIDSVKHCPFR